MKKTFIYTLIALSFVFAALDSASATRPGPQPGGGGSAHTHPASAIVSGILSTARLGSGTADNTTYLRGDGTWAIPSGSSTLGHIRYYGSPGRGSTNTNILRYSTADSDNAGGTDLQMVQSTANGDYIETLKAGNYSINAQVMAGPSGCVVQVMVGPTLVNTVTSAETGIRATKSIGASAYEPVPAGVVYLPANTKIWVSTNNAITTTYPLLNQLSVARVN